MKRKSFAEALFVNSNVISNIFSLLKIWVEYFAKWITLYVLGKTSYTDPQYPMCSNTIYIMYLSVKFVFNKSNIRAAMVPTSFGVIILVRIYMKKKQKVKNLPLNILSRKHSKLTGSNKSISSYVIVIKLDSLSYRKQEFFLRVTRCLNFSELVSAYMNYNENNRTVLKY